MASFSPKVFIRPDGLKRIANDHLIALLEPWREYFAGRKFVFPTDPEQEFPHGNLARVLLTYDPDMPPELMNGLYYIDEGASEETLDWLLERATEEGIEISPSAKPTTADVAVQIHLALAFWSRGLSRLSHLTSPRSSTTPVVTRMVAISPK